MDVTKGNLITHRSIFLLAVAAIAVLLPSFADGRCWAQSRQRVPFDLGYLFIDGRYLPPPYEINLSSDTVSINGKEFAKDYFDLSEYEQPIARDLSEMRGGRRMMHGGARFLWRRGGGSLRPLARFSDELNGAKFGFVVVLFQHRPPLFLDGMRSGHDLLAALARRSDFTPNAPPWTELEKEQQDTVQRLVSSFQPTDEFVDRASKDVQQVEEAAISGQQIAIANIWLDRISYPLTVFAMALVVLGFGHLLSNRPQHEPEGTDWSKRRQFVAKSLTIVALLSAVDLIWTIAASSSGSMREMNPLGSEMITDPLQLFLFKASITSTSIGILYWLHRLPIAQVASWWCCLLMTLLTARWVVFQSMFL